MADDDAYDGVIGAVRYSYGESESRLFRSYVAVGSLVTLFVSLLFVSGIVTLIAATTGGTGGNLTVVRAFFVVVLLVTIAPILAPVLVVARRIRRGVGPAVRTQFGYGLAGYGYLVALYLGVVVWAPEATEPPAAGAFAPVIAALNAAPDVWGLAFPAVAAAALAVLLRVVK
ncbi:MAG: hypothetical protein ABEJ68_08315 [Halobacteriaceae archaeon]